MDRTKKLEEAITKEAAVFFERQGNRNSLITITRTLLSRKGNHATLFISVFPEDKEKAALDFINRNLGELRTELKKRIRTRMIPTLRAEPDHGEQQRDAINRLLMND